MKTATTTGKSLITIALSLMLLLSLFAGCASAENMPRSISSDLPEYKTVHVSTADEFLAAIGNNTQIVIDADLIDFSTASDYGKTSGSFYGWEEQFDGPELVIMDVKNLQIIGQGQDKTLIQATPRYADVISFRNCEDLTVSGLTAGHLKEAPGSCIGGVLNFEKCAQDCKIEDRKIISRNLCFCNCYIGCRIITACSSDLFCRKSHIDFNIGIIVICYRSHVK